MAGKKLTDLTGDKRATTLEPTDLVLITRDPDGAPKSMSLTGEDLATSVVEGVPVPTASDVFSTPTGTVAAANVQDAIAELDGDVTSEAATRSAADAGLQTQVNGKAAAVHTHAESDVSGLVADLAGKQPSSSKLTTLAGLDDTQTGVIASDGTGWFRKTYSALKTALSLTKTDVGLGNVDNTSDVNKPVSTAQQTALNTKQDTSAKGQANGYASLDGGGKVPIAQLPSSIMEYQGVWNASTNSPALADGSGNAGDVYRVGTAGTRNLGSGSITFDVGDYAVYNGSTWEKSDTTDSVPSVFGRTGNVAALSGDYNAGQITNTPTGNIAATTVQAALNELDAEKQPIDSDLTAIAAIAPANDDIIQRKAGAWVNRTMVQLKTDLALTKSDVGLGNVDNTSDANKPVSTAQAAADATKVSKSGDTITGNLTIQDAATPTKAYRFRTSGGSLDFETGGTDIHLSTWENPNFTGSQYDQIVLKADGSDIAVQRQMDMNSHKLVNVTDPGGAQDAATKNYVDSHNKRMVRAVIDGGGSAVTTGAKKVYVTVPFNGTITKWRLQADQLGSAVIDIWKDTFANTPPTVADTITAAAKPTLSSAQANESTTLTGWTTTVNAGDVLEFNVDSASTVQRLMLDIFISETF